QGLANPRALVVPEDEGLVLPDGPAGGEAELVLAERPFAESGCVGKEVSGVQLVVAEELPQVPVKLVGPALESGVQRRAARAPEFRAVVGRFHFELGNRVDRREGDVERAV